MRTRRYMFIAALSMLCVFALAGFCQAAKKAAKPAAKPAVKPVAKPAPKPSMPPEAKAEYDLGNVAFDQGDWDVAIEHFNNARKIDKRNPRILFNLGLGHAKASHELPAIAWLEAYLSLMPNDPKADDIRKEITRLTAVAEGKASKVLKSAQSACDQLLEEGSWNGEEKHYILKKLAMAYVMSGNPSKAAIVADLAGPEIGLDYSTKQLLHMDYASRLMCHKWDRRYEREDPEAAFEAMAPFAEELRKAAKRPFTPDYWLDVCESYYHQGNREGLRKAARLVLAEEDQQKWLNAADEKEFAGDSLRKDPCDCWITLADELSGDAKFTDLEFALKTITDKDVFANTWTRDKGIRSIDIAWHTANIADGWYCRLRDIKSIRKFLAGPPKDQ